MTNLSFIRPSSRQRGHFLRMASTLFGFALAPIARAQAQNLAEAANQAQSQLGEVFHLISTFGWLVGLGATALAIYKCIEATQNGEALPIQHILAAAAFLGLPFFVSMMSPMLAEQQSVAVNDASAQTPSVQPASAIETPKALALQSTAPPGALSSQTTAQALPQPRARRAPAKPWTLPDLSNPDAAADAATASLNAAAPAPLYWPGQQAAAFPREMYDDSNATGSDADQAARREHAKARLAWIGSQSDAKSLLGRDVR